MGWPETWHGYVERIKQMGRKEFRTALDGYRKDRPPGDSQLPADPGYQRPRPPNVMNANASLSNHKSHYLDFMLHF
jgi:hypothetical protein